MIRFVTQNLIRFLAAVVLLALLVCALEVGLRGHRLWTTLHPAPLSVATAPPFVEPHRLTFHNVTPLLDVIVETPDRPVHIRTNDQGLRGPRVEAPKPRGTYRVLCLGSEDTFAPDVEEDAVWCSLLRKQLQSQTTLNVEVLNAGCPEAGPLVQVLRCQRFLALQPDLIVIAISPRDMERDLEVRRFLKLDDAGRPTHATHPQLNRRGNVVDSVCEEFYVAQWVADTMGDKLLPRGTGNDEFDMDGDVANDLSVEFDQRLVEAPLAEAARLAAGVYAQCLIVISPAARDLAPRQSDTESKPEHFRQLVVQIAQNRQIPLCDLTVDLRQHPQVRQLYARETGRFSPQGHAFIATRLGDYIVSHIAGVWGTPASTPPPNISLR